MACLLHSYCLFSLSRKLAPQGQGILLVLFLGVSLCIEEGVAYGRPDELRLIITIKIWVALKAAAPCIWIITLYR